MANSAQSPARGPDVPRDPSPSQRRGACGHLMAIFDAHQRCARCREAGKGQDLCVLGKECHICSHFTPSQKQQLATPRYRERKEQAKKKKETDVVVNPSQVTVLGPNPEDPSTPAKKDKGKGKKSKEPVSDKPTPTRLTASELAEPVTQQDFVLMGETMKSTIMEDLMAAQDKASEATRTQM